MLSLPEERLREPIDADEIDTQARRWRQDHVGQAVEAFAGLEDTHLVDATQPADRVADEILRRVLDPAR